MKKSTKWILILFSAVIVYFFVSNEKDNGLESSFFENDSNIEIESNSEKSGYQAKQQQRIASKNVRSDDAQRVQRTLEHPISIVGDSMYVEHIKKCLDLLATKSTQDYEFVIRYIGEVVKSRSSGIDVRSNPPSFKLSEKSAYYSLTWCSSILVHDAFHSFKHQERIKLGQDYLRNSEQVFAEEREANARQINTLLAIDAPQWEINHMKKQDGRHGDVNKDGKYDWEDQQLRNW